MIFLTLALTTSLLLAQTVTPTTTPTSIRDNIKKQVSEELNEIKQAVSKRGWIGQITTKTETGATITTSSKETKTLVITTDTTIKLTGGKEGTLAELKEKDYVLVMGNVDGAGTMTAVRLLVISKPTENPRKVAFGTVTKISSTSITIETLTSETWTTKLSSTTKYNGKVKATDIKEGSKVVILGTTTAKLIHLFL